MFTTGAAADVIPVDFCGGLLLSTGFGGAGLLLLTTEVFFTSIFFLVGVLLEAAVGCRLADNEIESKL